MSGVVGDLQHGRVKDEAWGRGRFTRGEGEVEGDIRCQTGSRMLVCRARHARGGSGPYVDMLEDGDVALLGHDYGLETGGSERDLLPVAGMAVDRRAAAKREGLEVASRRPRP